MYKRYILFLFVLCSCESFFNEDISDSEVIIIAPQNNSVLTNELVRFNWEEVEFASDYKVQIVTPDFENANQVILDTITDFNEISQRILSGTYEWRVQARNAEYSTDFVTNSFISTAESNFINRIVLLNSPEEDIESNSNDITLSWTPISEAVDYRVQVFQNNTIILDQNTTQNQTNLNISDGEFDWRVRASNGQENTLWSERSGLIDTVPPNTPTLSNPIDNSAVNNTTIAFDWNRTMLIGARELDSIFIYDNSNLSSLVIKDEANGQQSYTTTLNSGNTYFWKVKSYDTAGNESMDSAIFSFQIN